MNNSTIFLNIIYNLIFGTRLEPCLKYGDFFANFNALLLLLQPSSNILKSTADAFPPVIELANRAYPQDCGVWFGLEPDEKYAPSPLLTIFLSALIEQPVFLTNSLDGFIFCILYI